MKRRDFISTAGLGALLSASGAPDAGAFESGQSAAGNAAGPPRFPRNLKPAVFKVGPTSRPGLTLLGGQLRGDPHGSGGGSTVLGEWGPH